MKTFPAIRTVAAWVMMTPLLFVSVSASPRPSYRLTDLSAQPGAIRAVIPYAVNKLGHVVGAGGNANGQSRPFVYRDGVVSDPGTATGYGEAVAKLYGRA